MKIIKIVLLVLILSMSGCGLFCDDETSKEPSLDSGKDLKIWVGMPYEDAREALLDFNCEDVSQYIGSERINTSPYNERCYFGFIESMIILDGDKENADDTLKAISLYITNSAELGNHKQDTGYSFGKLTISDGEMKIEGLEGSKIYVGMKYSKVKEIIENAGVTDIVEENYKLSYRTNYKLQEECGAKDTIYDYRVLVYVDLTNKVDSSKIIEAIYFNCELDLTYKGETRKSRHQEIKCIIIDVKYPHGLQWGWAKIIE